MMLRAEHSGRRQWGDKVQATRPIELSRHICWTWQKNKIDRTDEVEKNHSLQDCVRFFSLSNV